MAWTLVKEQGHLARSGVGDDGERTAERTFIAVSDVPTTTVAAESASAGGVTVPGGGGQHPDDPYRRVKSKDVAPDPESNRTVFAIVVRYSSKAGEPLPENPLDRDVKVAWDFNDGREPYFTDRSTPTPKPVVDSAGVPFDPFLDRDSGDLTAVVAKNIGEFDYDPALAIQYKDAVNSVAFALDGQTIAAGTCKMKSWTVGEVQEENGYRFRVATWRLDFRPTWDDVVADRGHYEKDADNAGKLVPILSGAKDPSMVTRPWPLDGSGVRKPNATDAPANLTFVPYNKKSFSPFTPWWS